MSDLTESQARLLVDLYWLETNGYLWLGGGSIPVRHDDDQGSYVSGELSADMYPVLTEKGQRMAETIRAMGVEEYCLQVMTEKIK